MNASSESGECASLISTGSFSVFEAVCWPDMGLSVPIPVRLRRGRVIPRTASKRLPGPGAGSSQRDFPTEEGSIGDERRKLARRRGLRGAGPGDFLQEKPSISASREQLEGDKQGKRIMDSGRYKEETMRAMASSKEAVPSRYGCQNFCNNLK